jgi:hypothetical protein
MSKFTMGIGADAPGCDHKAPLMVRGGNRGEHPQPHPQPGESALSRAFTAFRPSSTGTE